MFPPPPTLGKPDALTTIMLEWHHKVIVNLRQTLTYKYMQACHTHNYMQMVSSISLELLIFDQIETVLNVCFPLTLLLLFF